MTHDVERHIVRVIGEQPRSFVEMIEQSKAWSVRGPLREIRAPTLCLVREHADFPAGAAREIADGVDDGLLHFLPGDAFMPPTRDMGDTHRRIAEFLRTQTRLGASDPRLMLTRRQQEAATLVARGATNKEVAHKLGISEHTVVRHLSRIYAELSISNRTELAARLADASGMRP